MRHIFSLYVMIPIIIVFSLCNGLYFHTVSNSVLYIGTAIVGFGAAIISVFYGSFIQGDGAMFVKGTRWVGLIVYALFFFGSIAGIVSTYSQPQTLHVQTIENIRYIFLNFLFAFSYGAAGLVWSFLTIRSHGLFRRLPKPKQSKFIGIER